MEKEKLRIGLLYLALHNQLIQKYPKEKVMTRREFFIKLGRHHQIKREDLKFVVIKEMEKMGLIKCIDRDNLEILDNDISLEKNATDILIKWGII